METIKKKKYSHARLRGLRSFGVHKPPPTHEQAVELGKKGGAATRETIRKKQSYKLLLEEMMGLKVKLPEALEKEMNNLIPEFNLESINVREATVLALLKRVLTGDPKAFAVLRDTAGEVPTQKNEHTGPDGAPLMPPVLNILPVKIKDPEK